MRSPFKSLLAAVVGLLFACAPDVNDAARPGPDPPADTAEAGGDPAPEGSEPPGGDGDGGATPLRHAPGRILVFELEAPVTPLTVYEPSGEVVATLPTDPAAGVWLPSWTPDGSAVVWAESLDGASWTAVRAVVGRQERDTAALSGRPDHVAFGPSADEVLFLGPTPDGFGLSRVVLQPEGSAAPPPAVQLDRGAPFFFDVGPGGVIAHVGDQTRLVGGAEIELVGDSDAAYQTPVWHPDGRSVFYARRSSTDGLTSEIVTRDIAAEDVEVLASYRGLALFAPSPDGDLLAVSVIGDNPVADLDIVEVATRPTAEHRGLDPGVWVIDLTDHSRRLLSEVPLTAPEWDPTGTRMLGRTAPQGLGTWAVLGVGVADGSPVEHAVRRGGLGAYYLRFWDQFSRTQTHWAPDGSAFVFPARVDDDASGVWIQSDLDGRPTYLVDGDLAFWAPDPE